MAQRCSEWPGGATHFGSGWAAKSAACSASERKPELTIRSAPPRSGRRHPVEGGGDVGSHPLPLPVDQRSAVAAAAGHPPSSLRRPPPAPGRPGFGDCGGLHQLRDPPPRLRAQSPSPTTATLTRSGAKERSSGNPKAADARPRRRSPLRRTQGLALPAPARGKPPSRDALGIRRAVRQHGPARAGRTGRRASSEQRRSRPGSAARCALPLPVTAPAIATKASAAAISARQPRRAPAAAPARPLDGIPCHEPARRRRTRGAHKRNFV